MGGEQIGKDVSLGRKSYSGNVLENSGRTVTLYFKEM